MRHFSYAHLAKVGMMAATLTVPLGDPCLLGQSEGLSATPVFHAAQKEVTSGWTFGW